MSVAQSRVWLDLQMDVAEAVDGWVTSSLADVAEHGFAQIDLDDLLDREPPSGAKVGFECLQRIMRVLPDGSDLDGLLTLPLDFSERMDDLLPSLDDLLEQGWSYGRGQSVPGLYMLDPLHWRGIEVVEEYRVPLESQDLPRCAPPTLGVARRERV